jgi:hypothetical protein
MVEKEILGWEEIDSITIRVTRPINRGSFNARLICRVLGIPLNDQFFAISLELEF